MYRILVVDDELGIRSIEKMLMHSVRLYHSIDSRRYLGFGHFSLLDKRFTT